MEREGMEGFQAPGHGRVMPTENGEQYLNVSNRSSCCGVRLLMAVLLVECTTQRPLGAAAATGFFNPRGSFGTKSATDGLRRGTLHPEETRTSERNHADEFHPRRSYSEQFIAMMQNLSRVPSAALETRSAELYERANYTSVHDLAHTLLADPMSLFRRRRRPRDQSAKGTRFTLPATARSSNTSTHDATSFSEDAANATEKVVGTCPAADEGEKNHGIQKLSLPQREALVRKWGAAFEQMEEEAFALFCRLHSGSTPPVGRLTKQEFAGVLRILGADRGKESFDRLLHFMFEAIDLERRGSIGFPEFVEWLLLITSENVQDRLRWGFQICDVRATGRITKPEVTALIRLMFGVLTGLELNHRNPCIGEFVSSLFQSATVETSSSSKLPLPKSTPNAQSAPTTPVKNRDSGGFNKMMHSKDDGWEQGGGPRSKGPRSKEAEADYVEDASVSLEWEEYRRGCLGSADVMTAVKASSQHYRKGYYGDHALHDKFIKTSLEPARKTLLASGAKLLASAGLAQRLAQVVFMTQRKCDFILTLMLGLQTAIEPDLVWRRECERERQEAQLAAAAAAAGARSGRAPDTSPLAILKSFISPPESQLTTPPTQPPRPQPEPSIPATASKRTCNTEPQPTTPATLPPPSANSLGGVALGSVGVGLGGGASGRAGGGGASAGGESQHVGAVQHGGSLRPPATAGLFRSTSRLRLTAEGGSWEGGVWEEAGIEHRTFEIPQLLYRKPPSSSSSYSSSSSSCSTNDAWRWTLGSAWRVGSGSCLPYLPWLSSAGSGSCLPPLSRLTESLFGKRAGMSSCAACAGGAAPRANSFSQDVLGGCGLAGLWGGAPRGNSTITAYGVRLFRDIRRSFGVSEESFLASLGIKQVLGGLLMGDMRNVAERVSEGRSGSYFYYSHDGKFMVKTVSKDESDCMRAMLPDYYSYVLENPDTLLMRILGQFELEHDKHRYHLVVLANVFNTTLAIHERFDLKGSSYKRTLGRLRGTPGLVHRDVDFIQTGRRITVSDKGLADKLKEQIRKDAGFLKSQGVVDYSLLVGIHRRLDETTCNRERDAWIALHKKDLEKMLAALKKEKAVAGGGQIMDEIKFLDFAHFAFESTSAAAKTSARVGTSDKRPAPGPRPPQRMNDLNGRFGISVFQQLEGGLEGSTRPEGQTDEEVIFVGIIDTLVPFRWRKRTEYWLKSVLQYGQNFSVVPPAHYAARFTSFCTSLISAAQE